MCNLLRFQYGGEHQAPPIDFLSAHYVKSALEDLAEFMSTSTKKENKDRQKLLRTLRVSCESLMIANCAWFLKFTII